MDSSDSRLFAFAVWLSFAAQLFTPLAYASGYYGYYPDSSGKQTAGQLSFATPSPTPAPTYRTVVTTPSFACNVKSMSVEEANRYMKELPNFQAEQISSAPVSTLQKTDPTNETQLNKQLNVNINVNQQPVFPFSTVMDVFGFDNASREEVAREFNVDPDYGSLNLDQVKALSARKPGGGDKLAQLLGISDKSKVPLMPYENFKVRLPNGKEAPLAQILNLQPQNKEDNCLLDSTHIQGKVTFMGLLNQDLFVGFDKSPTAVKAKQHITSKETTVALNNYAGTMILPRTYEKAVNYIGAWNSYEMWASLIGAASLALAREGPAGIKKDIDELEERSKRLTGYTSGGGIHGGAKLEELRGRELTLDEEIFTKREKLRHIKFASTVNYNRPLYIFLFGLSWLGPARFGLSASNQMLFSTISSAPKFNDNYLQIYVNNREFAEKFRRNTDVMGTGIITDYVSNFIEGGAPRKAFQTGKLMFINRDSTPDEQASDSLTSFSRGPAGWNVRLAWKGPSDNTMFEDIRAQKDYTSFALYSNNLALGTTLQNKQEFSDFYRALAIAAPFLNMIIFKGATEYMPASVATLARMGIADFIITRVIDPTQFSADDMCTDERLNVFLTEYTVFTSASIAESAFMWFNPQTTLIAWLGTKLKLGVAQGLVAMLKTAPESKAASSIVTRSEKILASAKGKKALEELEALEKARDATIKNYIVDSNLVREADDLAKSTGKTVEDVVLGNQERYASAFQRIKSNAYGDDITKQVGEMEAKVKEIGEHAKELKDDTGKWPTFEKGTYNIYKAIQLIDPIQLGKSVVGSQALEYASLCKDTSYKIMAYQKISGKEAPNIKQKLDPLKNFKSLNLSSLLLGFGNKTDLENMPELLNLRGFHRDEEGLLSPEELYYVHLDGASQQWYGVYYDMEQRGCFRLCHDSKDGIICDDGEALVYTDKKTGKNLTLTTDRDRAKLVMASPQLAKTIVPNKIIEAPLQCGDTEILSVAPGSFGGTLYVMDNSCGAANCLRTQLSQITGRLATDDLSESGFGAVTAVYTTKGIATAANGKIRFLYTSGTEKSGFLGLKTENLSGTEVQAPSLEAIEKLPAKDYSDANKISILGNGEVVLQGYTTEKSEKVELGSLMTVFTENGRIEYDPSGQRLVATLYKLAVVKTDQAVKELGVVAPATVKDEKGNDVPAISINNVVPTVGNEKEVKQFNDALKEIQRDISTGQPGGFQVLETEGAKYVFSTNNVTGKPQLTVYEKVRENQTITNPDGSTSTVERVVEQKARDYQITGPMRREGNDLVIPTDKGDFRINLAERDGKPVLQATGPDGFTDLAALLAARGPNGILAFDPRTGLWYALNGQDIPWNQDFANRGLSYYNSQDGARGVPGDNLLAPARRTTGSEVSGGNPLALPSFPENNPALFFIMLFSIVAGVVVIRLRRGE